MPAPARLSFDAVAASYDRGRPGYPDALIDDVIDLVGVRAPRVLEVGAGTGTATRLFAQRDLEICALEPSPPMAALARRNCAPYPRVSVIVSTFEGWSPPGDAFDLVVSAQAWHWVAPDVGYAKAHEVLASSGGLGLFWTHPLWDEVVLGNELLSLYERHAPELAARGPWFPGFRGPHGAERPNETNLSGLFGPMTERSYRWSMNYATDEYIDLLESLPEHQSLPTSTRSALLQGVTTVIAGAGGSLRMNFETRLYFSTRV
jgi:SAM-dependent methyltransferase